MAKSKNAKQDTVKTKESDIIFLLTGITPDSLSNPHKNPATTP